MSELLKLLCKVVQVVKLVPCMLPLCPTCPPHLILYNFCNSFRIDNFLILPNLFLILVHVFRLVLLFKWFKEYSINYIVPSCALKDLQLMGVGTNCFDVLVRSWLFGCQRLIVPSLYLKLLYINQDQIVSVEVSGFFNMLGDLLKLMRLRTSWI